MIKFLFRKYQHIIAYLFFGVCTTLVNLGVYSVGYRFFHLPNILATITAWFVAVFFAFVTNKMWVFESNSLDSSTVGREIVTFFGCRFATGVVDIVIMFLAVDIMIWNGTWWKLISNIVVTVLNYLASKLIIFKKKR